MARKTNKTAHVLNLLANGTARSNEPEQAEHLNRPAMTPSSGLDKPAAMPSNSIMENLTRSNDQLAGLIKDSLDKEISLLAPKPQKEPQVERESAAAPMPPKQTPADGTGIEELPTEIPLVSTPIDEAPVKTVPSAAAPEVEAKIPAMSTPSPQVMPAPVTETAPQVMPAPVTETAPQVMPAPVTETAPPATPGPVSQTVAPAAPVSTTEAAIPSTSASIAETVIAAVAASINETVTPTVKEPEFRFINMMEFLLDERHLEFMNRFDTCTCERCRLDVKALAMSNLPPKYLVSPIASIAPLTSFYRSKYNLYIVTELTKACLAIINDPRH